MKLVVSGALVLALVGSFGYFSDQGATGNAPGPEPEEAGPAATSEFILTGIGVNEDCRVRHSPGEGSAQLDLDRSCARILPRLVDARIWEERPDGTVVFVSAAGEALVEFYPGDGAAYESLRPRTPLLSLYREN